MHILGAIGHVIRVSEPKPETSIVGLNSSSSKTYCTWGIKVSNLEASGYELSALKIIYDNSNTFFFFIYLFIDTFFSLFFIYLFINLLGLPRRFASAVLQFFPAYFTNS